MDETLDIDPISTASFRLPAQEGGLLHLLHEKARVISMRYRGETCEIEAEVPESVKVQLEPYLV